MSWHDISELPKEGSLCILEESGNNGTLSYRIARYVPSHGKRYPWQLEKGTYADGACVTRLFRRICDFGTDMYRDDQWQEP